VFGRYEGDISYKDENVSVSLDRSLDIPRYERTCRGEKVVKSLSFRRGKLIINPVEPVNLPLPLTRHLEIRFPVIALPPGTSQKLYLSFPLEIGVFLDAGGDIHVLDIFSLSSPKFSLYGPPDAGFITRWHRSDASTIKTVTDRYREGVIDLTIRNSACETVEVSRAVFDSDSMHLCYADCVEMEAVMDMYSPMIARTTFPMVPARPGMERCIELYTAQKIPVVQGKGFLMEYGMA
jgi:hypothetical protein